MASEDNVLYEDIKSQLSDETLAAIRGLRIITHYGDYMTAGTMADELRDKKNPKAATEIVDAAFMYDTAI